MQEVYLLIGSNMGDRFGILNESIQRLNSNAGRVVIQSAIYETKAWGIEDQNDFLNQVLKLETDIEPIQLLKICLDIEKELGRVRFEKWGQRVIDIDILYYGNQIIESPNLIVPHPYLHSRRFTMVPLAEIAPDFVHPIKKLPNVRLLEECEDELAVIQVQIAPEN